MEIFEITKITPEGLVKVEKALSEEIPLTIEVNGNEIATILASPSHIDDLAKGFLFTSGMISGVSEIRNLFVDMDRFRAVVEVEGDLKNFLFKRIYTSGCGKGVIFHNPLDVMGKKAIDDDFRIENEKLIALMKKFVSKQREHSDARGVHEAAMASSEAIYVARVDIGRHNAIDKVIGASLAAGVNMSDKILLTTGRVSSEIFSKILRARIPVITALGSCTNQAAKLARVTNITLVARARGGRGEIFSGEQRII
ncbi:MAG: formate dehydrogenase accessory protein [Syntrophus sp. PtaB.Bin001]|nr:MAG: formate dehydrogenase accessory protein [Syntrophus sp. PtaB.Bin001]